MSRLLGAASAMVAGVHLLLLQRLLPLLLLSCAAAAHTWLYDDLVAGCRPQLTVWVRFREERSLHSIHFSLSTGSIVNERLAVNSSDVDGDSSTELRHLPCLYHGINTRTKESVFASVTDATRLRATFEHGEHWYSIEAPVDSETPVLAKLLAVNDTDDTDLHTRCHSKILKEEKSFLSKSSGSESTDPQNRRKRSLKLESFHGAVPLKMLELVLVGDVSFVSKAGSSSAATARMMEIANYVNGIYQAFSLRVVLKQIILWSSDPFRVTNDMDRNLRKFTIYKATLLNETHDAAVLLTWRRRWLFTFGVSWDKGLCDRVSSSVVVRVMNGGYKPTATVVAHEIGHLLGLKHINQMRNCRCPRGRNCVMASNAGAWYRRGKNIWTNCSYEAWKSQTHLIRRSCLKDAPQTSFFSSRTPLCGNGILEAGEQCDCGPSETCSSSCCNAATCQLKSGAACASGSCCNWDTCQLQPKGHRCRFSSGICDVPETCNGTSEWCPEDDTVADGVACDGHKAYCYAGKCNSVDSQCKYYFSSSAVPASDECYKNVNTRGDEFGHCSSQLHNVYFSHYSHKGAQVERVYNYTACSIRDSQCGLLQCSGKSMPKSATNFTIGLHQRNITCFSQPDRDLSSSGIRSPSLVPNGAACGTYSMCVDSTCRPLTDFLSCSDCPNCHGRGVLTAKKLCFCAHGFAPPNCREAGCGGTITSTLCINATVEAAEAAED